MILHESQGRPGRHTAADRWWSRSSGRGQVAGIMTLGDHRVRRCRLPTAAPAAEDEHRQRVAGKNATPRRGGYRAASKRTVGGEVPALTDDRWARIPRSGSSAARSATCCSAARPPASRTQSHTGSRRTAIRRDRDRPTAGQMAMPKNMGSHKALRDQQVDVGPMALGHRDSEHPFTSTPDQPTWVEAAPRAGPRRARRVMRQQWVGRPVRAGKAERITGVQAEHQVCPAQHSRGRSHP